MSSVDNIIAANTGEEQGDNENTRDDVGTNTVLDADTSSDFTNINASTEEKNDITGIVVLLRATDLSVQDTVVCAFKLK